MSPKATLALLLLAALLTGAMAASDDEAPDDSIDWLDCSACHDTEFADLPSLSDLRVAGLGAGMRVSCLDCHDRVALSTYNDIWVHQVQPLAAHVSCTSCHTAGPHGPGLPTMESRWGKKDQQACFECHRDIEIDFSQQFSHGFVPGVMCRDCHSPHQPLEAAIPSSLLEKDLQELRGSNYDWYESNTLCLKCHSPASLTMSLSEGFVTLNTENYHDQHLELGNVMCIECHDPHGSRNPGMVRSELLTGEALYFLEEVGGGTCAVVCHGVEHDGWSYTNKVF